MRQMRQYARSPFLDGRHCCDAQLFLAASRSFRVMRPLSFLKLRTTPFPSRASITRSEQYRSPIYTGLSSCLRAFH